VRLSQSTQIRSSGGSAETEQSGDGAERIRRQPARLALGVERRHDRNSSRERAHHREELVAPDSHDA
jgi:hypothetical protein